MGMDPSREHKMTTDRVHAPAPFSSLYDWRPAPIRLLPNLGGAGDGTGTGAGAGAGTGTGTGAGAGQGAGDTGQGAGDTGQQGQQQGQQGQSRAQMTAAERAAHYGFPLNTRVEEMTADQASAYHKANSDRWESRARLFDGLTPEALKALQDKAARTDALEFELSSDSEKAVKEAVTRTTGERDDHWKPIVAKQAVRAELKARGVTDDAEIEEILGTLDLSKFLTDAGDDVDQSRIEQVLRHFGPATGNGQQRQGAPVHGQGQRQQTSFTPGQRGREEAARRFATKT